MWIDGAGICSGGQGLGRGRLAPLPSLAFLVLKIEQPGPDSVARFGLFKQSMECNE